MTYVRLFIAAAIVLQLTAQTKPTRSTARKTFVSPDGAFRFKYPGFLVSCKEGRSLEGSEDSCSAYLQTCDDDAFVCMAYPAGEYRGSTTFSAATFSVTVLPDLTSESRCLNEVDLHWCRPPQGYEIALKVERATLRIIRSTGHFTAPSVISSASSLRRRTPYAPIPQQS
jgi:hypothetical protein